jgi:hypothetical protein
MAARDITRNERDVTSPCKRHETGARSNLAGKLGPEFDGGDRAFRFEDLNNRGMQKPPYRRWLSHALANKRWTQPIAFTIAIGNESPPYLARVSSNTFPQICDRRLSRQCNLHRNDASRTTRELLTGDGLCTVEAMMNTAFIQTAFLKRTFDCGARSRPCMTKEMFVFIPLASKEKLRAKAQILLDV